MNTVGLLSERVRADYLARDRYGDYRRLIEEALAFGFEHCSIVDLNRRISAKSIAPEDKIFVHRHDIDTDAIGARKFFEIEKALGIRATYYFRLSTIDRDLMREIEDYGSEASYHYEELATYAKRHGLHSRAAVMSHMSAIKAEFESNFRKLEQSVGIKFETVVSHGDFANRRIGLKNFEILKEDALRKRLGIVCECYDDELMNFFQSYISDNLPGRPFQRGDPFDAIKTQRSICLLTHPRHWRAAPLANTRDNLCRVRDEIVWQWKKIWC